MTIKEEILKAASDPIQGKIISASVLSAIRRGKNPRIQLANRQVRLVRVMQMSTPLSRAKKK